MAGPSNLRWVLYEDVYQPALAITAEDLADEVLPEGYSAVYLLGLDSTIMVPESDVAPYDPHDRAKSSHPQAVLGVATAQQILDSFHRTATEEEADTAMRTVLTPDMVENMDALDLAGLVDDDAGEEAARADAKRRKHEAKALQKEEKKKAKEAKKTAVKREREDSTSAPTLRTADRVGGAPLLVDGDEDELLYDDGEENSIARALEKKYQSSKHKHREEGEVDEEEEESAVGGKKKPKKATRADTAAAEEADAWAALNADLYSDEDLNEQGGAGGARAGRAGNRMEHALAALNSRGAARDMTGFSISCPYAQPYLMELHYAYEQLSKEAVGEGRILSMQKGEVVRALDVALRQKAGQKAFLASVLQQRLAQQQQSAKSSSGRPTPSLPGSAATEQKAIEAIEHSIANLEVPVKVEKFVHQLVQKQMPSSAIAFDRAAMTRARRAVQRRTRTFQDVSVVSLVDQMRGCAAAPREDEVEMMRRYIQQRRQHEDLKANSRGLSKTGFHAVRKPLERWKRARDMMMVANAGVEAQRVRPTSYISQAHATIAQKMQEHAKRNYDRLPIAARAGATFLDASSFNGNKNTARDGTHLLSEHQQRLAASLSVPRREAFFQFHPLQCADDTAVMMEATPLSQNVLQSVQDIAPPSSSMAPLHTMAEDSVLTDDGGASQHSFSVPSTTASLYPFLYDDESRHNRRGRHHSSRSGYSSDGGSASRAGSVESSRTANDDAESSHLPNSRSHPSGGNQYRGHRDRASNSANTAGDNSVKASGSDWRANAKRSLMEQLTLYCKGRGGKPVVLTVEECKEVGQKLLERAMHAEALRQGVSLAVQSNNQAAPFTKKTEQQLKKSVDHYLARRVEQAAQQPHPVSSVVRTSNEASRGMLGTGLTRMERTPAGAGARETVDLVRQRVIADTPIYEN